MKTWQRPVLREAAISCLLTFRLREPADGADGAWRVQYQLQPVAGGEPIPVDRSALDKSSARHLTSLLSKAASICPDIREDSDSFPLDVTGAFRFLTETASALEREGFAVAAPDWWKVLKR